MKKLLFWMRDKIILLAVFFSVSLLIFAQSYFFGAYISSDSRSYLRAAQSLCDGHGFYINAAAGDNASWFAVWPIGYPALIALVSLLSGAEIYLASKILSVIILAIITVMFYCRFKKTAWVYTLVVTTNFGFLQIFWYTWSEQPFILGLIWLSFAAVDILESQTVKLYHYINIGFASLFLFFSRYIGAFSIGVLGILALYHLIIGFLRHKKEYVKKATILFVITGIVTIIMIAYLYNNKIKSGYFTGTPRLPPVDGKIFLFMQLCKAQLIEIQNVFSTFLSPSYGIAFILYFVCAILCWRFFSSQRSNFHIHINTIVFLLVGILYWCSIVCMRFSSKFDPFSFRLLFPASALFSIGITSIILKYRSDWVNKIITRPLLRYICLVTIVSSIFSYTAAPAYHVIIKHNQSGYIEMRSKVLGRLASVPSQSLIIGGNPQVHFMRPDLITMNPRKTETSEHFLSRIEPYKAVYIDTSGVSRILQETTDTSIYDFFTEYKDSSESFVQFR
jgi:hypothetical protein